MYFQLEHSWLLKSVELGWPPPPHSLPPFEDRLSTHWRLSLHCFIKERLKFFKILTSYYLVKSYFLFLSFSGFYFRLHLRPTVIENKKRTAILFKLTYLIYCHSHSRSLISDSEWHGTGSRNSWIGLLDLQTPLHYWFPITFNYWFCIIHNNSAFSSENRRDSLLISFHDTSPLYK